MNLHWLTSVTNGQLRSLFQCQTMSLIVTASFSICTITWLFTVNWQAFWEEGFSLLYDVIPFGFCYYIKPEMSLRDYRKSKVEKKFREEKYRKKSFEISTALVLQMKILEFSPKCINFFSATLKWKRGALNFHVCVFYRPFGHSQSSYDKLQSSPYILMSKIVRHKRRR